MAKNKNTAKQILFPVVVSLSLAVGILIGMLTKSTPALHNNINLMGQKYKQILNLIDLDYVDTINLKKLSEENLDQLLENLDPHTRYIPKNDRVVVESQLQSSFEGIGIEFHLIQDTLWVTNVVDNGPSQLAGLQIGDKIIAVNDTLIAGIGLQINDVYSMLRGPIGSVAQVAVKRMASDTLYLFDIVRGKIPTNSVRSYYMIDDSTGVLMLSRFSENTYQEFYKALQTMNAQGMRRLVLDLRGNGGGFLHQAVMVLEEFLPKGTLLVDTRGKNKAASHRYYVTKGGVFQSQPLVILVDEHSASAAEIVAGALQDNDRAWIVGRRTYGKGLVQSTFDLLDGSSLRLTVSRYYMPSGRCIQRPYNGNLLDYEMDLHDRKLGGEYYSKDSLTVDYFKQYATVGGRTVYGGGGVSPDVFVKKDSTLNSDRVYQLLNQNVLSVFAIRYTLNHIDTLKSQGKQAFLQDFKLQPIDWRDLAYLAISKGVSNAVTVLPEEKTYIHNYVKALIAKHVWDDSMYFRVMHANDPFINQAIQQLNTQAYIIP